jgi:hypothetical protein
MILGTKLWYGFFGPEKDDDAALDRQVAAMCRELGDRGKAAAGAEMESELKFAAERLSPSRTSKPAQVPAPAPAPAPATAPTLVPAGAHSEHSFSPSLTTASATQQPQQRHQHPVPMHTQQQIVSSSSGGSSLLVPELTALLKEMRREWKAEMKAEQEERKRELQELEAKLAPREA